MSVKTSIVWTWTSTPPPSDSSSAASRRPRWRVWSAFWNHVSRAAPRFRCRLRREPVTAKTLDYGLFTLRLVLGLIMVVHGSQKLFTFGYPGVSAGMAQAGLPAPQIAAALIIAAEFGGGL